MMERVNRRLRQVNDYRPQTISIAVNGQPIASCDVSASINRLEVEVRERTAIEFIEVLSEQGVCLLGLPVLSEPPHVQPELCRDIQFGEKRKLELLLRFTGNGALIEEVYCDDALTHQTSVEH